MNIKHTIAGATIILATTLGAAALTQTAAETSVFVPDRATVLAPASADPYPSGWTSPTRSGGMPDPVQLMSAETPIDFDAQVFTSDDAPQVDAQVYTSDDAPQVIGIDPGIYFVPVWGPDANTGIVYV